MISTRTIIWGAGAVALAIGVPYLLRINRLASELESVTTVVVHKVNLSGIELRIMVTLKNPTGGSIKVKQPFVKLLSNEVTIASSDVQDIDIVVPKFGTVNLDPISITIGLISLATTAPALLKQFREQGKLTLVVKTITTINDKLPYTKTDNIVLGSGVTA